MSIKNYNSTHSLADYTVGNAYKFYIHNFDSLTNANHKTVTKYSSVLSEIIDHNVINENHSKLLAFTPAIGIVVDKHKSISCNDVDIVTVMFKTNDNNYVLNNYVVNFHDVFTNSMNDISCDAGLCTAHVSNISNEIKKEFNLW